MTAVVEGEVVGSIRRIERNAARTPEVLPPDVHTKVSALQRLDGEGQARAVTAMLSHARTGLLTAIAAQDLPQIVEWKQKAAAIQEIAKQVRLGKDMQLDAAEFLRRAERGLGVAIREGQERGEILGRGDKNKFGNQWVSGRDLDTSSSTYKPAPTEFASASELSGNKDAGIYAMTDNVSDAQFADALADAKAEGNLSRANVARKCKAKAHKESIDADDPLIDADVEPAPPQPKKRLTKHDSTEMLANINGMLNGIVETIPFITPADIDITDKTNRRVIENIRESMGRVRKLLKEIENG